MRGLARRPGGRAGAVLFLFAGLFLLLAFLLPKPWDKGLERRIQARVEKGQPLRPEEHAARLLFWVAIANAAGCAALGVTARWWARPIPPGMTRSVSASQETAADSSFLESGSRAPSSALFWPALILLAGLAFWLRWPLATKSLWWDEAWTVRHVVVGERVPDPQAPSGGRFVKRNWARTAWYYAKPTNHAGFSVLSRLCNDAWRAAAGAPPWAFSEPAVRLPSLLASAGAVVLIGLLGRTLVGVWGGLAAALALAAHPWFIRYGVDARAFGLNVLLSLAASAGFFHAIRTRGSWAPLALLGFVSFALIFTFPYNAYLPAAFFLTAAGAALFRLLDWGVVFRLAVVNTLAAMIFIQAAAPWAPQAAAWTDVQGEDMAGPRIDAGGLAQTWASFLTGTPLRVEEGGADDSAGIPSLSAMSESMPWLPFYLWIILPALFAGGAFALASGKQNSRDAGPRRILLAAWLLSLALPLAVAAWKQHYYYERYIIYALPGVILLVVAGAMSAARLFPPAKNRAALAALFGAVLLAPLLAVQEPQRRLLQERPYSPARDVADYLASIPPSASGEPILLGYGLGSNVPPLYNPRIRFAYTPPGLLDAMREAAGSGRPLYVFYGYSSFNRHNTEGGANEAFRYLDDPELFEEIAAFKGIEPAFYHRVLRYSGKPVDPSQHPR